MTHYPDHIGIAKTLLEKQAEINALRVERDALVARIAELEGERGDLVTAPDRAGVEAAVEAATRFADAMRYQRERDDGCGSRELKCTSVSEDGKFVHLTEPQLRAVLTELERLTRQQDQAEYGTALASLRAVPSDEFADLRAFCTTWLAELEQHGWLSRRLLLVDGSELDVGRLAKALERLGRVEQERDALEARWDAAARTVDVYMQNRAHGGAPSPELHALFGDRIANLAARDEREAGQ